MITDDTEPRSGWPIVRSLRRKIRSLLELHGRLVGPGAELLGRERPEADIGCALRQWFLMPILAPSKARD